MVIFRHDFQWFLIADVTGGFTHMKQTEIKIKFSFGYTFVCLFQKNMVSIDFINEVKNSK